MRDLLPHTVVAEQRGFVPTRSLEHNILDVGFWSRKASFQPELRPCELPLDFGSAFSSVPHEYLAMVWAQSGLPAGLIMALAISQVLVGSCAPSSSGCSSPPCFWICRGIRQGCPTSGWCWSVLSYVILALLMTAIDHPAAGRPRGVTRACADDIAIVLFTIRTLALVQKMLAFIGASIGLILNISK